MICKVKNKNDNMSNNKSKTENKFKKIKERRQECNEGEGGHRDEKGKKAPMIRKVMK